MTVNYFYPRTLFPDAIWPTFHSIAIRYGGVYNFWSCHWLLSLLKTSVHYKHQWFFSSSTCKRTVHYFWSIIGQKFIDFSLNSKRLRQKSQNLFIVVACPDNEHILSPQSTNKLLVGFFDRFCAEKNVAKKASVFHSNRKLLKGKVQDLRELNVCFFYFSSSSTTTWKLPFSSLSQMTAINMASVLLKLRSLSLKGYFCTLVHGKFHSVFLTHFSNLSRSSWVSQYDFLIESTFKLSAKLNGSKNVGIIGRSFINMQNSNGPRSNPRGTPRKSRKTSSF